MINNINKIKSNILDIKYLLSLEQANELLDIIRLEDQEKSHLLSHSIAKWLMKPWIQSDKFHHSSLCYYGNYGEEPNLKSGFIFKRNHDIFFIN